MVMLNRIGKKKHINTYFLERIQGVDNKKNIFRLPSWAQIKKLLVQVWCYD